MADCWIDPTEWVPARRDDSPPYPLTSALQWAARWGDSPPPVGTVLSWAVVESGATHVAICVDGDEWATTASLTMDGPVSFVQLARLIANSPCEVAIDWREIPTVEARPSGKAAVRDWAAQFIAPAAPTGDVETGV